jgi:capsular polysaccharide biosynthesis protein
MEEIELKEIFLLFWSRKFAVMSIIIFFILIGGFYNLFFIVPEYKASATIILAKSENGDVDKSITQTELTLNQKLVSTYSELMKSKAVLNEVIDNLQIPELTETKLKKNISVNAIRDTELIEISVTHENSAYVDVIANEVSRVFMNKVAEIYKINNVHVVNEAEPTNTPYNTKNIKYIIMALGVGIMAATTYVIIASSLDSSLKTSDEIESKTGLLVLATIPKYNFEKGENV